MPIAMRSRIKKWKREKNKRNKIRDLLFNSISYVTGGHKQIIKENKE